MSNLSIFLSPLSSFETLQPAVRPKTTPFVPRRDDDDDEEDRDAPKRPTKREITLTLLTLLIKVEDYIKLVEVQVEESHVSIDSQKPKKKIFPLNC